MSTFRLSRFFSQPEILRGIDPENLLSLLADHAPALEVLGLKLPDEAAVGLDYDRLIELLMTPDRLPAALREAFYFIHELATEEGMACLLDAAEKAGPARPGRARSGSRKGVPQTLCSRSTEPRGSPCSQVP